MIDFEFLNDCIHALRVIPQQVRPKRYDYRFSMRFFFRDSACRSPACVSGHYAALKGAGLSREQRSELAASCLTTERFGLSDAQRGELFSARGCGGAQTAEEAIDYIKDFIRRHGGVVREDEEALKALEEAHQAAQVAAEKAQAELAAKEEEFFEELAKEVKELQYV